ncbi:MAG: MoaD/ThiS family protein [Pseudomonadales bacterium]|nr:MoaD/ThiS family protein [Pseudomonadales bacterium]MBO6566919.1 MoaD/ThiS family protein [Pseudomonadales bacterium]MBO6597200.1 MoaD/ThiS family protein [Pseudomonadales bacterium]MBO6655294.1 MoaD/ThiS family protein [Pseudomonadales bacterium]MBO6703829.1 MoaD/ThiS family protein [Pseudomonadales bacterium]
MQVGLSGPLRAAANGEASIHIEAETIRELLNRLLERYPAMKQHMEIGIAVSIDGAIYRDNWTTKIPEGADVYLLPRIAGG